MTHLVTGAAGFIGFHLVKALLAKGDEVVGIDSINDYYDTTLKIDRLSQLGIGSDAETWSLPIRSSRHAGLKFIRMRLEDAGSLAALVAGGPFDRVINLAAQAGVRYSIENPRAYVDANLVGFLNVLEACRSAKTPHLVYASSSSIYGMNESRPFRVGDHTDHPISLYAATKKANELMAHAYSALYDLPTTGLRFFTVYGPWGRPDMAYFKFAKAILSGGTIDVYNNGDMLRDFTYIDDIVDGIIKATARIPAGDPSWNPANPDPGSSRAPYRVYNIGNNNPVALGRFIALLEKSLGRPALKNFLPMQAGDVHATEADVSALERDFGWRPTTSIEEGLKRFADWFLSREARPTGKQ